MTWLKINDKIFESEKIRDAGLHGRALWFAVAVGCASRNGDGLVDRRTVADAGYLAEVSDSDKIAAELVRLELWHDAKTLKKCEECNDAADGLKLTAGQYYIHNWTRWQISKEDTADPRAKWKAKRKRALLRNRELCEAIQERDGTLCRYCLQRVSWTDRSGPKAATYDHVDPDGWNTLENVVVACKQCNGRKRDRTPGEAGITLHGPPRGGLSVVAKAEPTNTDLDQNLDLPTSRASSEPDREPDPVQVGVESELDQTWTSRARHAQDGTGQVGASSESGRGPGRLSSDRDWSGEDGADDGTGPGPSPADFPTETHQEGESA